MKSGVTPGYDSTAGPVLGLVSGEKNPNILF